MMLLTVTRSRPLLEVVETAENSPPLRYHMTRGGGLPEIHKKLSEKVVQSKKVECHF